MAQGTSVGKVWRGKWGVLIHKPTGLVRVPVLFNTKEQALKHAKQMVASGDAPPLRVKEFTSKEDDETERNLVHTQARRAMFDELERRAVV